MRKKHFQNNRDAKRRVPSTTRIQKQGIHNAPPKKIKIPFIFISFYPTEHSGRIAKTEFFNSDTENAGKNKMPEFMKKYNNTQTENG